MKCKYVTQINFTYDWYKRHADMYRKNVIFMKFFFIIISLYYTGINNLIIQSLNFSENEKFCNTAILLLFLSPVQWVHNMFWAFDDAKTLYIFYYKEYLHKAGHYSRFYTIQSTDVPIISYMCHNTFTTITINANYYINNTPDNPQYDLIYLFFPVKANYKMSLLPCCPSKKTKR